MTSPGFNPSRAMDLSGIVAAAKAPPPPPGASYVAEVDERTFEAVLSNSVKYPIVMELTSPRANAASLSAALTELANAAGGAYLLARVDVDASPQIAAALGIQAVPAVIGVVAGQLAPLWQGTRDKEEAGEIIAQLLQAAAANGVTGRAEPVSIDTSAGPDPRFAAADTALAEGEFERAVVEFEKLVAANPNDPEAKAGRAQAALLVRVSQLDPAAAMVAAHADPTDVDAQLAAADAELMGGAVA
ncbi:MAG: tetratricopeptide repeat protein, partial [Propionicimonas sp.]